MLTPGVLLPGAAVSTLPGGGAGGAQGAHALEQPSDHAAGGIEVEHHGADAGVAVGLLDAGGDGVVVDVEMFGAVASVEAPVDRVTRVAP